MYLDFQEISKVPFKKVLIWLDVPFAETNNQIKGEGFIITPEKNLFFDPHGPAKGSIINFVAFHKGIPLREAAQLIQTNLMAEPPAKEIPEYELHYCKFLEEAGIDEETAKKYEIGLVKSRGMAAGKIAIKIRDVEGQKVAYALLNPKDGSYFYFKGYHHDHIYNLHNLKGDRALLVSSPLTAIKLNAENVIALTYPHLTEAQENLIKDKITYLEIATGDNASIATRLIYSLFVKVFHR